MAGSEGVSTDLWVGQCSGLVFLIVFAATPADHDVAASAALHTSFAGREAAVERDGGAKYTFTPAGAALRQVRYALHQDHTVSTRSATAVEGS